MMYALPLAIAAVVVLLAMASFTQLLYLESVRLRPRDQPSLSFFKDTLEDRIGFETEVGAACFSIVKHTAMLLLGLLYLLEFSDPYRWSWQGLAEGGAIAWFTIIGAAYAVPHWLYRRTRGQWLLPLVPALRVMGLAARPVVAILRFLQALLELTDTENGSEEPPTPEENIEALIDAGTEEGMIQEADPVGAGVRRQAGAGSDDAAAQHRRHFRRCAAGAVAPARHQ